MLGRNGDGGNLVQARASDRNGSARRTKVRKQPPESLFGLSNSAMAATTSTVGGCWEGYSLLDDD